MAETGARRRGREAALQVLYAADTAREVEPLAVSETFADVSEQFSLPRDARERARVLVTGVAANCKRVDEAIDRAAANWRVERLATVDRNVLRIAAYELLFEPDTPVEVAIDEALEIARRFSGETSVRFVNGVLDLLAAQRGEGE